MGEFVLDVQGFKRSTNIFQVKEVAIVPLDNFKLPTICLFKPACKFSKLLPEERKINRWMESSFHGIPWNSGSLPYERHIKIIQDALKNATQVYIKGFEKEKWLKMLLPDM